MATKPGATVFQVIYFLFSLSPVYALQTQNCQRDLSRFVFGEGF
jgi:hypothetical protein